MSKISKLVKALETTKTKNRSQTLFILFFSLTHIEGFLLRKTPPLGRFLKVLFSKIPSIEFIIENSIGIFSVTPFNDTMTISAEYFEEGLKEWLTKPPQKRIFIDIGANIGKYTTLAAKQFNYSQVVSIEANPVTFNILKKTIELNGIQHKVLARQVAVGDSEGTAIMQSDSHHFGGGNIVDPAKEKIIMEHAIEVPLITVDQLCKQHSIDESSVDFIKMDVEGMEKKVITGMAHLLQAMPSKSMLMIEISSEKETIVNTLTSYGFKIVESQENDNLFIKNT